MEQFTAIPLPGLLIAEEYLNGKGSKQWAGRVWKSRMRVCASPLRAELVREHREISARCVLCGIGEDEDYSHMLLRCTAYRDSRIVMFESLKQLIEKEVSDGNDNGNMKMKWSANSDDDMTIWLLSDYLCDIPVKQFLYEAFATRAKRLGLRLD